MRIIDLTMKISPSIKVFPGSPQPSFIQWSTFDLHGYDSEAMFMSTHTGTHVDAPSHFVHGMASIDLIRSSRLVSSAVLVNAGKRANQLVQREDLADAKIKSGDSVVIATGWENRQTSKNYMTENPGLSERAARYLVEKNVNAVAIDGPSIDAGMSKKFDAHRILLKSNTLIVENLCNLGGIKVDRFTLVLCPLKIEGATGSPARVLAMI